MTNNRLRLTIRLSPLCLLLIQLSGCGGSSDGASSFGGGSSANYSLTGSGDCEGCISFAKSTFEPQEQVTLSYQNIQNPSATDWIGGYASDIAENRNIEPWLDTYTNGESSGTISFTAPSEVGEYEIRLHYQDEYYGGSRSPYGASNLLFAVVAASSNSSDTTREAVLGSGDCSGCISIAKTRFTLESQRHSTGMIYPIPPPLIGYMVTQRQTPPMDPILLGSGSMNTQMVKQAALSISTYLPHQAPTKFDCITKMSSMEAIRPLMAPQILR